jgi:hypothetical protein
MRVGKGVRLVAPSNEAPAVLAGSAEWFGAVSRGLILRADRQIAVWMTV